MIVVPLAVTPLLMMGMDYVFSRSEEQAREQRFSIAVKETVRLDGVAGLLEAAGFELRPSSDPRGAVNDKECDLGLEVTDENQATVVKIYADESRFETDVAGRRIERALERLKDQRVKAELERAGVSDRILTPFKVETVNVASARKMSGLMLGNFLGYFMVILMLTGGMYPAIDMTAGEKERRTLEVLLASPASREEIVLGKILATITATVVTALLTIGSFGGSIYFSMLSGRKRGPFGEITEIPLDAVTLGLMTISIIPMAVMGAALFIAVATLAKSYKEAQSYLTPLIMIFIFPATVSFLPGFKLNVGLALIPVINFSQFVKELMLGDWSWPSFLVSLLANLVYAFVAFAIAVRMFKNESVLFRM
jgi:sodium transport system permease protein